MGKSQVERIMTPIRVCERAGREVEFYFDVGENIYPCRFVILSKLFRNKPYIMSYSLQLTVKVYILKYLLCLFI